MDACALANTEVEQAARSSAEAIERDDADAHAAVFRDVLARLPCLDEPIATRPWAALLVDEAIVRFAAGRPHADLVSAALRADPLRAVPAFLGEVSEATLPQVNGELRFETWVDGQPIDGPVALWGLHLVQARTPSGLVGFVVEDTGLPPSLVVVPEPLPPPRVEGPWGAFALGAGWADRDQAVEPASGGPRPTVDRGPAAAAGVWGRLPLAGVVGLAGETTSGLHGGEVVPTATGGVAVGGPSLAGWVGGGVVAVPLDDVGGRRVVVLPQPALGGIALLPGPHPADLWANAGWSPGVLHARARWGVGLVRVSDLATVRLGSDLAVVAASFVQDRGAARVRVTSWSATADLGVAVGR